jgi:hypothetical protein
MNVFDLLYIAIATGFFCACDWGLSIVDEHQADRNR